LFGSQGFEPFGCQRDVVLLLGHLFRCLDRHRTSLRLKFTVTYSNHGVVWITGHRPGVWPAITLETTQRLGTLLFVGLSLISYFLVFIAWASCSSFCK
jgi:hypothetical protein